MTMLHETVETVETVETGLLRALTRGAETRAFPLIVAAVAMATTLSMTIPFGTLLVAAVLLAPRRWRSIAATSSIGAAIGALVLYLVFHHLGWNRFFVAYPDVVRSTAWRDATSWLGGYGVPALLVIAALPVPLTPALMFAAISRLPVAEVLLALWLGKLVKYTLYAWLASAFPSPWIRRVQDRTATLHAALSRAQALDPGSQHRAAPGTSPPGPTDRPQP
ncbi:YqaA family protein [Diaphorobacter nitroreducens]|uniref:YqaA family protein n=1 Tax=Diaphorobacter nitroreducens TaxID=164759 RepID=UPI0028A07596|nr:VTT domain-containing protein [Diaphorobacter nitroreducens]